MSAGQHRDHFPRQETGLAPDILGKSSDYTWPKEAKTLVGKRYGPVSIVRWELRLPESAPKIELLTGETRRERVVTLEEEARYLAAASPLLAEVATVLFDTGMRPDELHRMCWEHITWNSRRHGVLLVTKGKTDAARREIPMTARVRQVLERRWRAQGSPESGWVFPAPTKSGHIDHSSVKKQHRAALKISRVRPFVLYSLRHTFLTRLGSSGCDAWTLMRIAGHSSIKMSERYVHPSGETVLAAISRMELLVSE